MNSRELMKIFKNDNIETRPLWQPLHMSTLFSNNHYYGNKNSEKLYLNSLSIPSSVGLNIEQQNSVIDLIKKNAK